MYSMSQRKIILFFCILDMSSSSSKTRSKSSDRQAHNTPETVYESNSITLDLPFQKKIEKRIYQSYHLEIPFSRGIHS